MNGATEIEVSLLDELRKNLTDLTLPKQIIEDKNLLRYLRARGDCVKNAETMFRRQIQWREDNDMDHSHEWQYPKEYKTYWPFSVCGFDKSGAPVVILPVGLWDASKCVGNHSDFVRYCCTAIESVFRILHKKSEGEKAMKQVCVVADLRNLSFRTVTTFDAVHGILDAMKVFESCYPEVLKLGLIINAPYVFEIIWRLIKPVVSEATHSKLQFVGSDINNWRKELLKYIDADQFPEKYGGSLPDNAEVVIENGCTKMKGTNSNDYICENFIKT